MKKLLSLLAAFALVLTLSSCTEEEVDPGTTAPTSIEEVTAEHLNGTTIEFWHAQSSSNGEALQAVVDKFNETNEYGITVNATYQGGYSDTKTKIQAALVAGQYPNIGQGYGNDIAEHMQSTKVVKLDDYFTSSTYGYTQAELDDFIPSFLEEMYAFEDGSAYQTMMAKSAEMLYYNVDFFNEHGLEVPTTTDELAAVAKEASEILGKPAFGVDSEQNFFITFSQAFGSEYTDNKGNVYYGDEDNRETTLEFLNWWKTGVDGGYFRLAGEDNYISNAFNNGDAVMFVGSTSGSAYISSELNWAPAHLPAGPEAQYVMQQGGNVFMLEGEDIVENVASWIFMSFMMEPENTNLYALNTGYVPIRQSSYEAAEYTTYVAENGPMGQTKALVGTYPAEASIYDPIFAASYGVRSASGGIIEEVALGGDPEEVLDRVYASLK